jgi:DNA-binding NtrC family response regulator
MSRELTILVVDDDPMITSSYARIFRREFKTVVVANDVAKAIEALNSGSIDVCVSDWDMPNGGGKAVLDAAKVPVVIITGNAESEEVRAERGRAVGIYEKPASLALVATCLDNAHIIFHQEGFRL